MWRLVPLFFLLPIALPAAGDAAIDRATLRGLKSFGVVVDRIDPELGKEGFDADTFQTRIEMRLRSAGLPVEAKSTDFVGFRVLHVRSGRGPFAVCLSLGVYQPVTLVRDPKQKTSTETWGANTVLMAQSRLIYRAALDSLDELVDHFIEAWRSVNPQ